MQTQIIHADRRRDVPRKEAMFARRLRQRTAGVGFTPVLNEKLQARYESYIATRKLVAANAGQQQPDPAQLHQEAVRAVAATLPPARRYG